MNNQNQHPIFGQRFRYTAGGNFVARTAQDGPAPAPREMVCPESPMEELYWRDYIYDPYTLLQSKWYIYYNPWGLLRNRPNDRHLIDKFVFLSMAKEKSWKSREGPTEPVVEE